ncbi:MAG: acetyl-CoA carboxylase biotin carboxyl carrier protein subunit [Lewinellaceae bacterium]|nr:acetyl-CoA carboxylase biotin carboxyl carrier protein subunit [Phaeodactylibacter sp.]MCB9037116.1 acetyl-CoA carboxylase biotin carboxyl carrier protein subunit [Lewinellaceae bacterium]
MNDAGNQFKATVNNQFSFDNVAPELDFVPMSDGRYHVLRDNISYHAEILHTDYNTKSFTIKVNGSVYEVQLADQYDQLVNRLGLAVVSQLKIREVRAPMPGLVLDISVQAGQAVSKGDPLLILEAMKMENVLKSPGDGVVKKILVARGEAVEKNSLLIEMD